MGAGRSRVVGHMLRVGKEDVLVTIYEEYPPDDSGVPTHVKVVGPNGFVTEGKPAAAWQEMLELLGVAKPKEAISTQQSAISQDEQPGTPIGAARPAAIAFTPAAATTASAGSPNFGRVSVGAGENFRIEPESNSASTQERQLQKQNQHPGGAPVGPVVGLPVGSVVETGAAAGAFPELEEDMEPLEAEEETQEEEDVEGEGHPPLNRNILRESMLRFLNKRIYSDDPPVKIDERMEAYIPYLSCTQEAATLIHHIEENIQLTEMQADAARRTANLKYLKRANRARRCHHVKGDGESCGSPALRGQQYCHFHAQAHGSNIDLPIVEDKRSLQLAYTKLAQQVAANKLPAAQAKVLLQILERAGRSLPNSDSLVSRRFPGI